jgi:hypothetical protein
MSLHVQLYIFFAVDIVCNPINDKMTDFHVVASFGFFDFYLIYEG